MLSTYYAEKDGLKPEKIAVGLTHLFLSRSDLHIAAGRPGYEQIHVIN